MHTYRGESHKGHLAERCSVKIAIKRSREPKIALWIMTGRSQPGFKGYSFHSKGSLEYSSAGKISL
jgi:hypothetical protein